MAIERVIIAVVMVSSLISTAYAIAGTSTFYGPPLVPSSCYGFQDQGTIVAAANRALFNNRAACGRTLRIRCTGGTNQTPNPCRPGEITVRIVDLCPGCANDQIDLSPDAFNRIGNPDAGRIRIDYVLILSLSNSELPSLSLHYSPPTPLWRTTVTAGEEAHHADSLPKKRPKSEMYLPQRRRRRTASTPPRSEIDPPPTLPSLSVKKPTAIPDLGKSPPRYPPDLLEKKPTAPSEKKPTATNHRTTHATADLIVRPLLGLEQIHRRWKYGVDLNQIRRDAAVVASGSRRRHRHIFCRFQMMEKKIERSKK